MKRMFVLIGILVTLFVTSIVQAEEIVLSSGSGPLDSIINPIKDAFEKESGIKIKLLFGSASLAFKQFYKGDSEVAMVGIGLDGILDMAKKDGLEVTDPSALRYTTIGKGLVRTIVNKENRVSKLSKKQLKGIFTGKITNWKDVGGSDSPILVVLSTVNPTTTGAFKESILDNEPYTREVLELRHMDEVRRSVEVNTEAISIGSASVLSKGIKEVETPEVSRPFILITKGEPSVKVRKLIDFIVKGPGKSLVKE